jgi:predicted nuclease with TOPRIM domain
MEEQLLQAKRALEDRTKASTRLQNRLAKIDSELNQYRERYGNLERQTKKSPSSRSRSLSPGERGRLGSTKVGRGRPLGCGNFSSNVFVFQIGSK